jgi:cytochrome c oxidase cbb3-type subunit 3
MPGLSRTSRRNRGVALTAALVVALAGCNRGGGPGSQPQLPDQGLTRGREVRQSAGVQPGISPQIVFGTRANPHAGDVSAVMAGRQLFTGMNCSGCHSAYAGGGMGPSLRDSLWIYGSSDIQIFSTLAEGRPYGMPAWGGRLTDDQLWQLVAYIKTLGTADEPVKPPTPPDANGAADRSGG